MLHPPRNLFWIILCFTTIFISNVKHSSSSLFNLSLPHQHPFPDHIALQFQRKLNDSLTRRHLLTYQPSSPIPSCLTGNPIDDCWRCDPNWSTNRQSLADCSIGFGQGTLGGKGGRFYLVTDSSDDDAANPVPGTLRHAVIQPEPLWIIFSSDMGIKLKHELIISSYKTIDGRGTNIELTGHGCLTIQQVSHVIIHNIHIHHCKPSGNTLVASSPTHVGFRGISDGDGISVSESHHIWIDHCSLGYCTDGLIDVILGSTAITISNNYFTHHDEVMLLGHNDKYIADKGMQVTIGFNHFGEGLVQRMPRCRHGYIHVVNNDFTAWEMYAIGGSANPTINSQGNRYTAPIDPNAKEVTKRVESDEKEWEKWNWRTEGDVMVNGAFFVPSGDGVGNEYARATSLQPKTAAITDQITINAGVFGDPRSEDLRSQLEPRPPCGVLSCHVDGAWKEEDQWNSCGWILRDCQGLVQYWGGKRCEGRSSALQTEAEALSWAIREIKTLGFRKVCFFSDCKDLTEGVKKEKRWASLDSLAQEIEAVISDFDLFSIEFTKRQNNGIADRIAKEARKFHGITAIVSATSPFWLSDLIRNASFICNEHHVV